MSLFTVILEQHTNMAIFFTYEIEKYQTHCIHISYVKIHPQLDANRYHTCKYDAKHVHMYHSDTLEHI